MAARIQLRNVTHRYDDTVAVANLSLTVEPGEVLALVGGSGSGKTTALKTINGLISPTSGDVLLDDLAIASTPGHEVRRGVGYVFQEVGLFPHMSVARNIGITPELLGWSSADIEARVQELLALMELDPELGSRRPRELSGGQQQRVGVARALAARPSVMLLDEPFGALDPPTRQRLQASFSRIHEASDMTVVFVTHDLTEAIALGNRIGVMHHGHLVQLGRPRSLFEAPANPYVESLVASAREQSRRLASAMGSLAP